MFCEIQIACTSTVNELHQRAARTPRVPSRLEFQSRNHQRSEFVAVLCQFHQSVLVTVGTRGGKEVPPARTSMTIMTIFRSSTGLGKMKQLKQLDQQLNQQRLQFFALLDHQRLQLIPFQFTLRIGAKKKQLNQQL